MSKSLKSLVRLSEWNVDERRRELAVILDQLDAAERARIDLENELKREQLLALESPQEAGLYYGSYADGVIARREKISMSIIEINERVLGARDALNDAYRELKKYETVEKNRLIREAEELSKKEQTVLDELGLQSYSRKQQLQD